MADMPKPRTIADGLQARLGELTWPVVRDKVDEVGRLRGTKWVRWWCCCCCS